MPVACFTLSAQKKPICVYWILGLFTASKIDNGCILTPKPSRWLTLQFNRFEFESDWIELSLYCTATVIFPIINPATVIFPIINPKNHTGNDSCNSTRTWTQHGRKKKENDTLIRAVLTSLLFKRRLMTSGAIDLPPSHLVRLHWAPVTPRH